MSTIVKIQPPAQHVVKPVENKTAVVINPPARYVVIPVSETEARVIVTQSPSYTVKPVINSPKIIVGQPAAVKIKPLAIVSVNISAYQIALNNGFVGTEEQWLESLNGNITTYTAGAAIGSQRLVMLSGGKVVEYDQMDEDNAYKAVGFTVTSVLNNEPVNVISAGILNNPGWGLTPDAIYYANGVGGISALPPASGISQAIGIALDSNNLFINFDEPIIL